MNVNPAAPENNTHHTSSGFRNEDELYEDLFGRGAGDPDMQEFYPGEEMATKD